MLSVKGKTSAAVLGGVAATTADVAGVHGCRRKTCVNTLGLMAFMTMFRATTWRPWDGRVWGLMFPARQCR